MIIAVTVVITAVVVGAVLRLRYSLHALKQIEAMQSLIIKICGSNETALVALQRALLTQGRLVETLQKEKDLLEKQLNLATETINDIYEEGDEDEESEDDEDGTVATKPKATVEDKLHTIKALLTDSVNKKIPIDADSLLSIVNCNIIPGE